MEAVLPRRCLPCPFLLHPALLLCLSGLGCPEPPFIFLFCTSLQQRSPHLVLFPGALSLLAQACQHGNSQHLEHLLFYGADSASQNASGNTALHICALYNKVPLILERISAVAPIWLHTFQSCNITNVFLHVNLKTTCKK